MPRSPRAGFSSCASLRNASGLSAPASSTRTTTFLPGNAASSCRVRLPLLLDRRRLVRAQEEELGSEQPHALRAEGDGIDGALGLAEVRQQRDRGAVAKRPGRDRRRRRRARDRRRGCARARAPRPSAAVVTTPAAASTITISPSTRPVASTAPTTATIDFSRARIAVCDVGPPSVVTSASTLSRSSRAVSAGARSFATSTNGWPGVGHAGGRHAAQPGDHALGDVVEVGRALAEIPAERGQRVAERREGVVAPRTRAVLPAPMRASISVSEARVLRHHRLRLENVLSGAAGLCPALLQLAGDRRDGLPHAGRLLVGAQGARRVARRRQRLGHPGDGPLRDAQPDAYSSVISSFARFGQICSLRSVMCLLRIVVGRKQIG